MSPNQPNAHMRVSVIVPVYNVAPYLRRCLDSLLAQTHRELEVVVVDDGSTDGSSATCDAYAARDPRVRALHQPNRGLSAARNAGLDAARGELVGFVDSDDWVEPDFYERLVDLLRREDADIAQLAHYEDFDDHTRTHHIDTACYTPQEALVRLECGGLYGYVVTQVYKRELWDTVRFPNDRLPCEDARTTYRVFLHARRIACADVPAYHYVRRGDSITGSPIMPMEVFSSRYDRYLDCQRLEERKEAFCGCARIFFEPLAAAAYEAAFLSTPEQRAYRGLGAVAERFWRENRWDIARIGTGYWGGLYPVKALLPRTVAIWLRARRRLAQAARRALPPRIKRLARSLAHRDERP